MMNRIAGWLVRIGAAGLIVMTGVIGWQVFGRFVLDSSPSWTEQFALILMIWYIFITAAAGVWERFHIRIEIFEHRLEPVQVRWLRILIHGVIAVFGLVLLVFGAQLAWLVREHVIPSLGVSRAVAYLPIPLAGLLTIAFSVARIRLRLRETV